MVLEHVLILRREAGLAEYSFSLLGAGVEYVAEHENHREAVVTFPEGTSREVTASHPNPKGEGMATYFTLTVPHDRYPPKHQRGVEIWAGHFGEWDQGSTVLYF